MASVVIRILLRYLAAYLVARGVFTAELGDELLSDPDLVAMLNVGAGAVVGGLAEAWYYFARRFGWSK